MVVGEVAGGSRVGDDDEFGIAVVVHVCEGGEKSSHIGLVESRFDGDIGKAPGVGFVRSVVAEESVSRDERGECGDDEVEVAVEVVVSPSGSGPFVVVDACEKSVDSCGHSDISEGPVAFFIWSVVHQELELARLWELGCGTERGDEEVDVSVVVKVCGGRGVGMERALDPPAFGLVGEGAVLVVDVERVGVERSEHEDVVESVVVEVRGDSASGHGCVALERREIVERGQSRFHSLVAEMEDGIPCG